MSQVQDVKQAIDILEVIGQRLQLQRAGSNYKAVCPFHSEKTPSFFVNQDLQRYKCFGCGRSGDALSFLQEYEGMTFGEALEQLADQAGITLERFRPSSQEQRGKSLLEVLDLAKEYYHFLLTQHRLGGLARDYLKQRGITAESTKVFQLGFAPAKWDGILTYLTKKKKYSPQLLEEVGLIVRRNGRQYDRFRDRLMFPLKDHRGQVVGFAGRLLNDQAQEAKYINSPETSLYHKSKLLYGYHELRQEIRKAGQAVVMEGELDVISSSQAHLNNVVAIKGSALTSDQARLLKRLVTKVVLALDTDAAGVTATKRAVPVIEQAGLELRVASLPAGKDPDELGRSNPKLLRQSVSQAVSVYEFIIEAALAAHDATTPDGKRYIMQEVAPYISAI
ncbi:MAG: DNA primase, partial [Candidatus Pacebacteria bacterium CG10_big_fil_rev_8_21_14_0_10_56_10]